MKKLCIAYSFDDNYVQHAGVSILSLLEYNKDAEEIIFYIITESLTKENRNFLESLINGESRKVIYVNLNDLPLSLNMGSNFNRCAYGRLFLSEVVDWDRIIYVDSDTVINQSLLPLMKVDMNNKLIAGVQDTVNPYYLSTIGLELSHRYICSGGVILLNLDLWRKMNIVHKSIEFVKKFNGNPPHNDQGTLNYVCAGYIKILPPKYNLMPPMFNFSAKQLKDLFRMPTYYSQEELNDALLHPVVVHYTDEFFNRPWFSNCSHPLKHLYLHYLSQSPWKNRSLKEKKLSLNCRIQNAVFKYFPYSAYKLMIRYIEWKHKNTYLFKWLD